MKTKKLKLTNKGKKLLAFIFLGLIILHFSFFSLSDTFEQLYLLANIPAVFIGFAVIFVVLNAIAKFNGRRYIEFHKEAHFQAMKEFEEYKNQKIK